MTDEQPSGDRRAQFEADLTAVRGKTGSAANDERLTQLGLFLAIGGVIVALFSVVTSGTISDSRELLERVLLSMFGLGLTVLGVAVYLRGSFGRYLRFWMLRMLYEQQDDE